MLVVACNNADKWLVACGDDGFVKVLQMGESSGELSMNQTLLGHTGKVGIAVWNTHYLKLATADSNGLIIVWVLRDGTWKEEMVNDRKKSAIADISWSHDGEKICIIYSDGAIIMGAVDGTRIWAKDSSETLANISWAPHDSSFLVGTLDGKLLLHDLSGTLIRKLTEDWSPLNDKISAFEWFDFRVRSKNSQMTEG